MGIMTIPTRGNIPEQRMVDATEKEASNPPIYSQGNPVRRSNFGMLQSVPFIDV